MSGRTIAIGDIHGCSEALRAIVEAIQPQHHDTIVTLGDYIDRGPDGRAGSFFSRVELTVRPPNEFNVVNIAGKGTIRDKEIFNWNYFEDVLEADQDDFKAKIDKWVLEFAEQFATR